MKYSLQDLQNPAWWKKNAAILNRAANYTREDILHKPGYSPLKVQARKQAQKTRREQTINVGRLQDTFERAAALAVLGGGTPQEQSKAFRNLQSQVSKDLTRSKAHLKQLDPSTDEYKNLRRHVQDLSQLKREMSRTVETSGGDKKSNPFNTRINAAVTYATEYRGAGMEMLHRSEGFTSARLTTVVGQSEIYDRFYKYYLGDRQGTVYDDMSSARLDDLYEQLRDAARRYDSDEFGRIARLITVEQDRLLTQRFAAHQSREA